MTTISRRRRLHRWDKFWQFQQDTQRQSPRANEMAGSEGSAVGGAVSVGARKVLYEDVLLVAIHKARVDLHPASLEKAYPCPSSGRKGGGENEIFDIRYLL